MAAIEAIVFAGTAGFAVIIVATVLVIVGVRQEERRWTFPGQGPPTIPALLARRVLGAHANFLADPADDGGSEDQPPSDRYPPDAARP
jgi:hypothetical protein